MHNNKGFISLSVFVLISVFLVTITSFGYFFGQLSQVNYADYYQKIAFNNSQLGIKDGINHFIANKTAYYDANNKSPCIANYSIRNLKDWGTDLFRVDDLLKIKSQDYTDMTTLLEKEGFINRTCSLYSKWLPHKLDAAFSFKFDIDTIDTAYQWQQDENGFYNIGIIYDNENKGYFFTKDQIGESQISINLDYNFDKLNGDGYLNVFKPNKYIAEKIALLKKEDPNLAITKTNLKNVLWKHLEIGPGDLEIGVIEFDGTFGSDGFKIKQDSGRVMTSDYSIWNTTGTNTKTRLLCTSDQKNCMLKNITLQDNKVYFFYLKSFDTTTTYHIDFLNNVNNSVAIPSDKLFVSLYGYGNEKLYKNETYYDVSQLGGFFNSFDSSIYNYVYFNLN